MLFGTHQVLTPTAPLLLAQPWEKAGGLAASVSQGGKGLARVQRGFPTPLGARTWLPGCPSPRSSSREGWTGLEKAKRSPLPPPKSASLAWRQVGTAPSCCRASPPPPPPGTLRGARWVAGRLRRCLWRCSRTHPLSVRPRQWGPGACAAGLKTQAPRTLLAQGDPFSPIPQWAAAGLRNAHPSLDACLPARVRTLPTATDTARKAA